MLVMQNIFMRLPVITELFIVTLAAWLVAVWLLPSEVEVVGVSNQMFAKQEAASLDMKILLDTPLFGEVAKKVVAPTPQVKPIIASKLKIKLIGTVVAGDRSAAVVVLQGGREQQLFFIGDVMKQGVVLKEVEADAIVVDNQGKLEQILLQERKNRISSFALPKNLGAVPQQPRNVSRSVNRRVLDTQTQNFPQLLSQARVVPHFANGKSDGFVLSEIVPGSLYQKVGLQNGDIIRKVNGVAVSGPQQAMAMFQTLKTASSIDVEIQRAGNVQQLHYDIR